MTGTGKTLFLVSMAWTTLKYKDNIDSYLL